LTERFTIRWLYLLSGIFIALNSYFIYRDMYWLFLAPVVIGIILLSLLSIDKLFMLIAIVTPLSLNLEEMDIGAAISLPSEGLIIGAMIVFLFKIFIEGSLDPRLVKHPVTIAIASYLLWILVTSFTSEIPVVSFKYLATRLWFIITCFYLGVHVFKKEKNIPLFGWMYLAGLSAVVIYTTARHAAWGFEKDPAHWVMEPFYYDHTQYGAMLAFFFPFVIGYTFFNRHGLFVKILTASVAAIISVGLFLSNSRAAWLSVLIAAGILVIMVLRIRWYMVFGIAALLFGIYWINRTEIIMKLEKNKQDSSENFSEHIQSMSNISSDASNLERLLRWNCAIRMYNERPVLGWGPGTYSFVYAPFQKSYELTIISTNFGDGGNAHSEYLGPLSEQGLMGLINVVLIIVTTFITACRVIYSNASRRVKQLCMFALLSLCTYWMHGFLNNFLDTDKAAVPYWGFIAMIVALDIYHRPRSNENGRPGKRYRPYTADPA